jgi:hypothetical protein
MERTVSQTAEAAKKELGAFLFAVKLVFGDDDVACAADLWVQRLETTGWTDADMERVFREITIRTSAQLAREFN